jgi:hypothetical protein
MQGVSSAGSNKLLVSCAYTVPGTAAVCMGGVAACVGAQMLLPCTQAPLWCAHDIVHWTTGLLTPRPTVVALGLGLVGAIHWGGGLVAFLAPR